MRLVAAAALLLAVALAAPGCPTPPENCLWTVTNHVGSLDSPVALWLLQVRVPGSDWADVEAPELPFGHSFSLLLEPDDAWIDLRAVSGEGEAQTRYSRMEAVTCNDGNRVETKLTSDDLEVPCVWTIRNDLGDPGGVNYGLLGLWARVAGGNGNWGTELLAGDVIAYGDELEITLEVGWTYDLSAFDQATYYYLVHNAVTCDSGDEFTTTLTLGDRAPGCRWIVTNEIDGDVGQIPLVGLGVYHIDSDFGLELVLDPPLLFGETAEIVFPPRGIYDLVAYDQLGRTYSFLEAAYCNDGDESWGVELGEGDVD